MAAVDSKWLHGHPKGGSDPGQKIGPKKTPAVKGGCFLTSSIGGAKNHPLRARHTWPGPSEMVTHTIPEAQSKEVLHAFSHVVNSGPEWPAMEL